MTRQKKTFYIVLATVVVTGLLFLLYASSAVRSVRSLRSSLEKIGMERARTAGQAPRESVDITKSVPQRMWTAEFAEIAYAAALKHGIRDLSLAQKSRDAASAQGRRQIQPQRDGRQPLQTYSVTMSFHSGYRAMADFIQELQGLERLVTIDSLKVRRDQTSLAVELTAGIYAMEGR